jgi:CDP-glucose 4,6-dehydratase
MWQNKLLRNEAALLSLDATKAQEVIGWKDKLKFDEAVEWTVAWHKRIANGESEQSVSLSQIDTFSKI